MLIKTALVEENQRGKHTYHEIKSEGAVWQATLREFTIQSKTILNLLSKPFKEVIFTGCGSTYYLSLAAAAVWQSLTGIRASAVPASELWLFPDMVLSKPETLLIAVSRSGETTETLQAVETFKKRKGQDILGISVYPDSSLVRNVPYSLVAKAAKEKSVAQTRSFTSMYLLTLVTTYLAVGDEKALDEFQALPDKFQSVLARYEPMCQRLAEDPYIHQFVFLGSNWNFGLASEVMLKMKEMSLSYSEAFHFLEFRHGPKSMAGPGTLIIGLLSDVAYEQEIKVLNEVRLLGAKVLALIEKDNGAPADFVIELQSGLSEPSRSILQLPVLQFLAFYRAMNKGLNPDLPTNLEAVVKLNP